MTQEELNKQYAIASALVKSWPKWKQNILENYSKPTVSVPRPYVDNFNPTKEIEKKGEIMETKEQNLGFLPEKFTLKELLDKVYGEGTWGVYNIITWDRIQKIEDVKIVIEQLTPGFPRCGKILRAYINLEKSLTIEERLDELVAKLKNNPDLAERLVTVMEQSIKSSEENNKGIL